MNESPIPIRVYIRLSGFGLVTWCVWITVWSLVPFQVLGSWSQVSTNLYELLTVFTRQPILRSVVEHIGLAFPIGFCGYVWLTSHQRRHAGRVCLYGSMIYLTLLEITQCFFERRHASIFDIMLSTAGVWVGIRFALLAGRFEPVYARWFAQYRRAMYSWLAGLGTVLMCYLAVIAHTQVNIEHWDIRFPLLVGNELSGDRPWLGSMKGLAIYDRALTLSEAATLTDTSFHKEQAGKRVSLGAQAIYDLTAKPQGQVIRQMVPSDPPLDLWLPSTNEQVWNYRQGVLEIAKPTLIRTKSFPKRLAIASSASNELSVELLVRAANLTQEGPARMVSMSHGVSLANFMLGQREKRIEFRVRTPRTGTHGARRICRSAEIDLADGWHHIVATYKDGVENIYVDGQSTRRPLKLYTMSQVVLRADWPGASVLVALVCFVPIGFAAGAGCRRKASLMKVLNPRLLLVVMPLLVLAYCAKLYDHEYDTVFMIASLLSAIGGNAWSSVLKCQHTASDQHQSVNQG